MARIRTLDFLPEVFQTHTNAEFLSATLDQIVNPPNITRVEGYIGSKLGYGINAKDRYVPEPTKVRTDYQLDPGVVFTKKNESIAKDFISYPGIIDALKLAGGTTDDHSRLFESQFYSWDSFTDLDKLINFNEYYWLPYGPPAVTVAQSLVYSRVDYTVTSDPNTYSIVPVGSPNTNTNPVITLLRGGTYTFTVNQDTNFWIQSEPGVDGTSVNFPNIPTRDVFGVENNGINQGVVTFRVPQKSAQNEYILPGKNPIDVISTLPFDQVNGVKLSTLGNIDGVTGLEGLRVAFYNTGVPNEVGFISSYYSESNYDINNPLLNPYIQLTQLNIAGTTNTGSQSWVSLGLGYNATSLTINQAIIFNGSTGGLIPGQVYYITEVLSPTNFVISLTPDGEAVTLTTDSTPITATIGDGLYEEGFYTTVSENFYKITYVGNPSDPEIRLIPDGTIPIKENIIPIYGDQWANRPFYRNDTGVLNLLPQITAPLDVLYYQDSVNPNKVGVIRLIESNNSNTLDVETDILGKKNFTSANGVVFTNGLKVQFDGDVIPASYLQGEYYVEGVGTNIQLIPVDSLVVPEKFTQGGYIPFDTTPFDTSNYDIQLYVPVEPDYITIARNSISKNAWSRSNRWFHSDVIKATATYNNNPKILTTYANGNNKAKRPIIEFYPNLKLFNSGARGKDAVDFIDTRSTDALSTVAGLKAYYPDVEVYTNNTAVINPTPVSAAVPVSTIVVGGTYIIEQLSGTTQTVWNELAGTEGVIYNNGDRIECVFIPTVGLGTGLVRQLYTSTTITVPESGITGSFQVGMFVGDTDLIIPNNSRITSITGSGTGTLTLDISWEYPLDVVGATNISIVGTDTTVNNYGLFTGARIVFGADTDPNIVNKIYVAQLSTIVPGTDPVITLALAEDGNVLPDEQVAVMRGYNYQGDSFYYDGIDWKEAQLKTNVNVPPLFDVFDKNGISFGDSTVYGSTTFKGCKLFSYGVSDTTIDDPILGFPIRYSTIDNVGDISFDVSLNSDTFNYVAGTSPTTQKVNTGYVYNYDTLNSYSRELGWQTAIAPSTQYQVFDFDYTVGVSNNYFTCDVAQLPALGLNEVGWPRIQVYLNNIYLEPTEYQVYGTTNSTVVILNDEPVADTVIQILLLSDQVSKTAYYTIPVNLNNNPFNADLETADIGDIRNQYRDIFINAPDSAGPIFGSNNFRDLGNLVPYGTKIIQNSASLVLPGTFLRKQNQDLFGALLFNSREYIKYKQLLVDTVQNTDYVQRYTPSEILDDALDQITAAKSQINAFFWSDMLPGKAAYRTNTYTFANSLDTSIYPLNQIYNYESANYNGVLVYLTRTFNGNPIQTQLTKGVDYIISDQAPSLTVTLDLIAGDKITIKEYNQTYGSYVPNTPTKLGLYPSFEPTVILDSDYTTPTYFILGHDGSYTKLYGEYIAETNTLVDFRDQALLEFEKRIYNNLKIGTEVVIKDYEVLPGFFRESDYTWEEWLAMYTPNFLDWIGQNRLDYKTQFYNKNDYFTFNYTNSQEKLTRQPIKQGYWRGLYQYFYDTLTPNSTPWQMLGFANQPDWWETRYGPAPYTSDNGILWQDLENGFVWNNGNSYTIPEMARPGLSQVIPVDSNGDVLDPWTSIVGNYNPSTFQRDWRIGDMGPVELSYRRSSTWPFDLVKLFALTKPAEFYNLAVDLDNYKYNAEFNQYLVNDRDHLVISNIEIYGNGIAKTSYINWIVDYEKQLGIDATTNITDLLDNLDVRLVYRLAGYSDKTLLKFYVEKGSPNSANASLLIPDESYSVLLYDNQPYDKLAYSSVIIQSVDGGYTVYGNSQTFSYFTIREPIYNGKWTNYEVVGVTARVAQDYSTNEILIPYGTKFYSIQEVVQFLASYSAWTVSKGMIFQEIENGIEINWGLMAQEFMYWTQTGWTEGSVITLNPAATVLEVDKENTVVQPLTVQNKNFILNQNLYPIQMNNICVLRDGTRFRVHTVNQGDAFAYAQFNLSNFEHGIVFDNETLFNDTIYNLTTGLRQNRIVLRGTKTAEWNGTVDAWGFVLNQDNVEEWSREIKYTKGSIVKYKNKYWSALKIVEPGSVFNELEWKEIDYQDIQKGLLPNASTRAYESTLYYDINKANLENDADLLSFSLVGYRPRDYLALADLTDITQINVYKNLIRDKGTLNAANAFKGANLPQGGIDYDIYENWAILSGEFGGTLNENFVEFKLEQPALTGNPSIVSLNNGVYTPGSQQEVSLYNLYNYGILPNSPNILNTTTEASPIALYPDAGYVNFNDVKMASYYYAGLPSAINSSGVYIPVQNFYVRDYMWLANFKEKWGVYSWKPIAEVIEVRGNINDTSTITFSKPHGLKKLDPIAIVNFADTIDGYYIVSDVINLNQVIINLASPSTQNAPLAGRGLGMQFVTQRVATPANIAALDLLESEFSKNTVWVDENTDGGWAVYRKSNNYQLDDELTDNNGITYGSSVAYTAKSSYLIGDAGAGKVYRYSVNGTTNALTLVETLSNGTSFGSKIVYGQNVYVISEPTSVTPKVYIYIINDSVMSDDMTRRVGASYLPYQEIPAPAGVTNWGSQMAMSDDANWIYISDVDNDQVYVYRRENFSLTAGYFVVGKSYTITSLGDTDFTAIGAVENKVGITFVASGAGTGTGAATQVSYKLANIIDGTLTIPAGSKFGSAIATDYRGDTVIIGAPSVDYSVNINDWGKALVYQRRMQNVEVQYTSIPDEPQIFNLGWSATSLPIAVTAIDSNSLVCADTSVLTTDDPVLFTGSVFSGSEVAVGNIVYYIDQIVDGTKFTIKTSRNSSTPVTINDFTPSIDGASSIVAGQTYIIVDSGDTDFIAIGASSNAAGTVFTALASGTGTGTASKVMIANVQTDPLYVSVNGTLVSDNNYAIVSNRLYYVGTINAGDIVNISANGFDLVQVLNSQFNNRPGIQFGYALDCDTQGSNIVVGAPYEINDNNVEGAAYSYINGGAKYGIVIGVNECNITTDRNLMLNGYLVPLTAGNAQTVASIINGSHLTNIQASATSDNKLIIQVINTDLTIYNEKLLVAADIDTLNELGIELYTNTQIVTIPHVYGQSQFGKAIKIDNRGSLLVSAPVGTRFAATTFDFTDDANLDNDTVFDNNATRFVDEYPNAGAVYMFDYLGTYNENLLNSGKFAYAQSVNYTQNEYGLNPYYGEAIEFNDNIVMVSAPDFEPVTVGGLVTIFNNPAGVADWSVFRQSSAIVDIEKIQNTQIFSAETNNTLANLDYLDPLQGVMLGAVRSNLDYVTGIDPAKYNSDQADQTGYTWGGEQVGQLWFNTNNVRFMNYHQNDVVYNSRYWGTVFPGSDIAVYTWVASEVAPAQYQGPGTPLNNNLYCVGSNINASGVVVPIYYFWARNTNVISEHREKSLSDFAIANYISNPRGSGIPFMAPLLPNTFALYNCSPYINANDSVFHIGYANGLSDDVAHREFTLIRQNNPDDFLPGLPRTTVLHGNNTNDSSNLYDNSQPASLYDRLLDSLSGCDDVGSVVPNPFLPKAVQSGVLTRPRQSFFFDRFEAVKNYLIYANDVLAQYPIVETRPNATFLFAADDNFDTSDYWEYINWWADGYDNNTKSALQVPIYADLVALNVSVNTLVTVEQNGAGKFEVYRYDGEGVWTRIGLENGTIQFKTYLWDYAAGKFGFGGDFFDNNSFDLYPSEETRYIVRALNEQIYIDELVEFRNKSLIILFEYIQSETMESQNYLPWLSKTSLVDVSHPIRELRPIEVFQSDNQDFLTGYINEVKPYHVVIKEFIFSYKGQEDYLGNMTDFDLPATYNTSYQKYITPQLVYTDPSNEYQYNNNSDIWNNANYTEWFNNYGLSITGQDNYPITILVSYVSSGSSYILVDNAQGFPINGVIRIGDEEISYAYVDRALNLIGGLVRGLNGSDKTDHLPGEQIYIDLPAVVVLDGSRNYSEPPQITAYIDTTIYPAPSEPAVFEAVMSGSSVHSVNVINPGKGYAVLPELIVDPAEVIYFSSADIDSELHTAKIYAPNLKTGDLVKFKAGTDTSGTTTVTIGNLANDQWYYVNVLEEIPEPIIAFYTNYANALQDSDRVKIVAQGESINLAIAPGAKVSAVSSSSPIRENNVTLRFDRTTYGSQVKDWRAGAYYGSFFAGTYYNSESIASSSILLDNEYPDINTILASAQGATFEIVDVDNDQELTWSSAVKYVSKTISVNNSIQLIPLDGNNPDLSELEPNASGTTIGFYVGMPVKFVGAVGTSGLADNVVYYVKDIIDEISFTVADENGTLINLAETTVSQQGLKCYIGQVVNTAILTVNYPGILNVTATTSGTNALTIPTSVIGTGGTYRFYTNLPVNFTGDVFGGIVAHQTYYITTVIDEERFTISKNQNPLIIKINGTVDATNTVKLASVEGLEINTPIIFVNLVGSSGGIIQGTTYYVSSIDSVNNEIKIALTVNGTPVDLTTSTVTGNLISQADTVQLTNATGSMTMNVSLPISPGQVNGQLFTLYDTSNQYPNIENGTVGDLIERKVNATVATSNIIAIPEIPDGTSFFYENMPVRFSAPVGGLLNDTTYYVLDYSGRKLGTDPETYTPNIEVQVVSTSSIGNVVTVDVDEGFTTESLYVGMPITFSGNGFGNINIDQEYYVHSIPSSTTFTIKDAKDALSALTLTNDSGIMIGKGDPYIKLKDEFGDPVSLTTEVPADVKMSQFIAPADTPIFDISYMVGGYRAFIQDGGAGFAINNTISIKGTEVGGTSPANDITLTVNTIDETDGRITDVICAGTPPGVVSKYYLKVISENQLAVYADPLMQVPVSGIDFGYNGFVTTTVTGIDTGTNTISVNDASMFEVNNQVVFTGNVSGGIESNQTYYIVEIIGNSIKVSDMPSGTAITLAEPSDPFVTYTMAKPGDFALLPEPFYFDQSIVKFNNRVYVCVISNNDDEFILGKWEILDSGDRRLNAMDRTIGYYQPTINMPGVDLTQLFEGVTYPNSTYKGNAFEPDQQFELDTVLQDSPFYPINPAMLSEYDVKGADFPFGYGPEELVPGIVYDNMVMTVTTRPGTNWPVTEYGYTGYGVNAIELSPTSSTQRVYSFADVSLVPISLTVQVLEYLTNLGTTLATSEYTVDWVNKTVTLNTPINYSTSPQKLRIEVYEAGNGDQLAKSNTDANPIRTNGASGFNEIYLDCNYLGANYQGGGIFQPDTPAESVTVIATDSDTNRFICQDVSGLVVNNQITFQGTVFGGVGENIPYYIKTISTVTNSITISASINPITGIAGATYTPTTATGSMYINLRTGNGLIWTDPVVYRNGEKLVYGMTGLITKLTGETDTISTLSTDGLIVGQPIVFCNGCETFGPGVLIPMQKYYIHSVVSETQFTISETQGGPIYPLPDAFGGARFVTNDYAFGLQENEVEAKIIFATDSYNTETDYIAYSVFGGTYPDQYGYTLPETQTFVANGSVSVFYLDNYIGGTNIENAIVEVDGIRLTRSQYSISLSAPSEYSGTLVLLETPAAGTVVSITTFNDTARQYLNTQFDITGNPESALASYTVSSSTALLGSFDQGAPLAVQAYDQTNIPSGPDAFPGPTVSYDEEIYYLTLSSGTTATLNINDPLVFADNIGGNGTTVEGIIAGKTYFIIQILDSTKFVVSDIIGGSAIELVNQTKNVNLVSNGLVVAPIETISNKITLPIATTTATATTNSSPNITVTSTAGFAVGQTVQFTGTSFDSEIKTDGTVYFVKTIVDGTQFTISATPGGVALVMDGGSGNMEVTVGGQPAVRVTTTIPHGFALTNDTLIRIDGVQGSTQLNNNTYYARVIDDNTFDLYTQPYLPGEDDINYPVTSVSSYIGGGYTWRSGLFYLSSVAVTGTSGTTITTNSTASLVVGTPIYFSKIETVDGTEFASGIISGTEYYVSAISSNGTDFTISETQGGPALSLTTSTETLNATQWSQDNVDRLHVTVNGYRVPSSNLRINPVNEISILAEIQPGDQVIITNMIPTATPNEEVYVNIVDTVGNSAVYRENSTTVTWVTEPVYALSDIIYVNNVSSITETLTQTNTIEAAVDGIYSIGLEADKNLIVSVTVFNVTTNQQLAASSYSVEIEDLTPTLKITSGVSMNDSITISILQGNIVYIDGEMIGFEQIDVANNALIGLKRGLNGTSSKSYISPYTEVFGLLSSQKLPDVYYNKVWNTPVYNQQGQIVSYLPLQTSTTVPANFLKASIS